MRKFIRVLVATASLTVSAGVVAASPAGALTLPHLTLPLLSGCHPNCGKSKP